MKTGLPIGALAPLVFGAALAAAGSADARIGKVDDIRTVGPDPSAAATAEAARAHGKSLLAQNKLPEALQSFRQALLQDPDSAEALNGMAVCYDRLGRFEDSRTHYEMALGIDPTSPVLLNNYGLSLFLQGKGEEAVRFLSLAAASGDPLVQAASLRTLARIEQQRRPNAAVSNPARMDDGAGEARIVRTSAHEQRLVLDTPAKGRQQQATAAAPETAIATAAIGALTRREETWIAAVEMAAIANEHAVIEAARAEAMAAAEAAAIERALPAAMRETQLESASLQMDAAAAIPHSIAFEAPRQSEWLANQLLDIGPSSQPDERRGYDRQQAHLALLATGLVVPRPALRQQAPAATDPAAGPGVRKREFAHPFASDNSRLNDFAERLHGHEIIETAADIASRIASLEALIERVRNA